MKRIPRAIILPVVGLLVVVSAGWLWWGHVRQAPNRVFWDMLSNNLSTSGVTHVVDQKTGGLDVSQYTQINFTQHPTVHALTVFKQNGNTLATEEISDPTHDFVRYQQLDIKKSSKKVNTGNVIGQWAQLQSGESLPSGQLTGGLFNQSLLDILPIGNLSAQERGSVLAAMRNQNMFQYNVQDVKKVQLKGRSTYLYAVTIRPAAYVRVMQQFEKLLGATAYKSLQPASFTKSQPISVVIAVDARSHSLSQIYETAAKRVQRYEDFGAGQEISLPTASLTTQQLTDRLAGLEQQ